MGLEESSKVHQGPTEGNTEQYFYLASHRGFPRWVTKLVLKAFTLQGKRSLILDPPPEVFMSQALFCKPYRHCQIVVLGEQILSSAVTDAWNGLDWKGP